MSTSSIEKAKEELLKLGFVEECVSCCERSTILDNQNNMAIFMSKYENNDENWSWLRMLKMQNEWQIKNPNKKVNSLTKTFFGPEGNFISQDEYPFQHHLQTILAHIIIYTCQ